ncbi:MAG: hypothetical protein VST71_07330 [Nitrospirota bacterium]|nr:hypothetical protein [Nitrospirota bacterium]
MNTDRFKYKNLSMIIKEKNLSANRRKSAAKKIYVVRGNLWHSEEIHSIRRKLYVG